ncbi:SHOCT domain-containing protein [Thermobifida cellulosilytica]|mgnify:CR=1 FL=1|uniref:SHOCT domain-containing protein n=1 Tax=Thermobifida cellulosilytica TB100 TaxID=665004 RepID=A0A147KJ06_THECS|nr:SHOCT domain-containing protein [Thermobifida cellulosilytica]KUP97285.1 hypothetical protein AC529_07475 [Thermobifida cellulosilytica TB100]
MYWEYGMGGWAAVSMTVTVILFWLLLIAAIVALFRSVARGERFRGGRSAARPSGAEQALAERFARGEIDEEEYRHRLGVLRSLGHTDTS